MTWTHPIGVIYLCDRDVVLPSLDTAHSSLQDLKPTELALLNYF